MAINITWEDERGEQIESWPDFALLWDKRLIEKPELLKKTCCLRFIDHYGDTTFNQSQIPVLISELQALAASSEDDHEREGLESLIAFVRNAEGEIHTYIKFWGD